MLKHVSVVLLFAAVIGSAFVVLGDGPAKQKRFQLFVASDDGSFVAIPELSPEAVAELYKLDPKLKPPRANIRKTPEGKIVWVLNISLEKLIELQEKHEGIK